MYTDKKMADLTAISITMFDGPDFKCWSLVVDILRVQKQVVSIADHTEEEPEDATKIK
jgi:hypothetical protein